MSDALVPADSLAARFSRALLPLLGALAVLGAIVLFSVLADTRHLGPLGVVYEYHYGDKAGHFLLFGLLTFMVDMTALRLFPNEGRLRVMLRSTLLVMVYMALDEFSQNFFPSRDPDILDLLSGYAGVAVAVLVTLLVTSRPKRRPSR